MAESQYRFDDRNIQWRPFPGFEGLYYWVLDVDDGRGLVDMLMRFDPDAKCVPHCHVGPTRTLVIEGEHRIYSAEDGGAVLEHARPAGSFATNDGDETHIEGGGPEGAVILLSMTGVERTVYEIFDHDMRLERTITLDDFKRGLAKQRAAA